MNPQDEELRRELMRKTDVWLKAAASDVASVTMAIIVLSVVLTVALFTGTAYVLFHFIQKLW